MTPLENNTEDDAVPDSSGTATGTQQQQQQHNEVEPTTAATVSSSTSSSPVLVSTGTDGEMTSEEDDDDDDYNDPLLLQPPNETTEKLNSIANTYDSSNPNTVSSSTGSGTTMMTTMTTNASMMMNTIQSWKELFIKALLCRDRCCTGSSSSSTQATNSKESFVKEETSIMMKKYVPSVLNFYIQFIASPSNQDKLLKLLQYTLYMCSIMMAAAATKNARQQQRRQGDNNHNVSQETTSNNRFNYTIASQWMDKLYNELTWARYILRILQFPVALDATMNQKWTVQAAAAVSTPTTMAKTANTSVSNSTATATTTTDQVKQRQQLYNIFGKILTYSMVLYYPTEFIAYLLWMKPKVSAVMQVPNNFPISVPSTSTTTTSTATALMCSTGNQKGLVTSHFYNFYTIIRDPSLLSSSSPTISNASIPGSFLSKLLTSFTRSSPQLPPETWSYISCRCWLMYIITESIQSYVQYKELQQVLQQSQPKCTNTDSSCREQHMHQQQKQQLVLQSVRNLLFMIPCTTWSMSKWDTNPLLPTFSVNTLLWFESIVSIYQAMIVQLNNNRNSQRQ